VLADLGWLPATLGHMIHELYVHLWKEEKKSESTSAEKPID
jgi:hypothetical protein